MRRATALPSAALTLAGGLVHLQLWNDGYRFIDTIGVLFLVNAALSVVVAAALVARPSAPVAAGAAAFNVGSLAALVLSRTVGVFGFTEPVWTNEAWQVLGAELGALAALAVLVVPRRPALLARA